MGVLCRDFLRKGERRSSKKERGVRMGRNLGASVSRRGGWMKRNQDTKTVKKVFLKQIPTYLKSFIFF